MENAAYALACLAVDYWWLGALLLAPVLGWLGDRGLRDEANVAVAAVYRSALKQAERLQDKSLAWLTSGAGIDYRRALALKAYHSLPDYVGPLPVKVVKALVNEDHWLALVQGAFDDAVKKSSEL